MAAVGRHLARCGGSSPVLFELRDVGLARGGRPVLDSVSAEIPAGATAIVGPSGSGKSTLLRLLNRLADPDRGTIAYRGRPLAEYDPLELRREVSLVPQLPALLEGTVGVEPRLRGASSPASELDAERCLRPRRPRSRVRRARRLEALGRRAAAGDAGPGARPAARRCCCSTSRPRRSTTRPATRSRRPSPSCARELRDLDRPRQPRPRAGAAAGRLGGADRGRPGGRRRAARARCWRERLDPRRALAGRRLAGARRARDRDLALAPGRPRARHRDRHGPLVRPADRVGYAIKLIFDADTIWLVLALLAVMVLFGALTARSRAKKVPGAFWPLLIALALAGGDAPSAWSSPSASSNRRRATWSRSAAW